MLCADLHASMLLEAMSNGNQQLKGKFKNALDKVEVVCCVIFIFAMFASWLLLLWTYFLIFIWYHNFVAFNFLFSLLLLLLVIISEKYKTSNLFVIEALISCYELATISKAQAFRWISTDGFQKKKYKIIFINLNVVASCKWNN